MRYVISTNVAGFCISDEAIEWLRDNRDWKPDVDFYVPPWAGYKYYLKAEKYDDYSLDFRRNPDIIAVVGALGNKACRHAPDSFGEGVKIVEVPDDVEVYLDFMEDGAEVIREVHRTWG